MPLNHTEAKDEKRAAAGKRDPSLCVPELKKRGNCTSRDPTHARKGYLEKVWTNPMQKKRRVRGKGNAISWIQPGTAQRSSQSPNEPTRSPNEKS